MKTINFRLTLLAAILVAVGVHALSCVGRSSSVSQSEGVHAAPEATKQATDPAATPVVNIQLSGSEALHNLFVLIEKFRQYVADGELSLIHNYDLILNSSVNSLYLQTSLAKKGSEEAMKIALLRLNRTLLNLHAASHVSDSATSAAELSSAILQVEAIKNLYSDSVYSAAIHFPEKFGCPMHPEIVGRKDDRCPKCGMSLEPAGLFSREFEKRPPLRARISLDAPLSVGEEAKAILHLSGSDGSPILLGQLRVVHTKKIHLLIVDSSLSDYWHVHPVPTGIPGDYSFTFVPHKRSSYRAWADVLPDLTGRQEYVMTDIHSSGGKKEAPVKLLSMDAEVDSLRFELRIDSPEIRAGKGVGMRLRILREDGTPFTQLEPIMGSFAHLVGFHEDFRTVTHIHPIGAAPIDPGERGGPELEFHFYSSRTGYLKLFAQVQIGGISKFAAFGFTILPDLPATSGRD